MQDNVQSANLYWRAYRIIYPDSSYTGQQFQGWEYRSWFRLSIHHLKATFPREYCVTDNAE